jgi:hypothetical protein
VCTHLYGIESATEKLMASNAIEQPSAAFQRPQDERTHSDSKSSTTSQLVPLSSTVSAVGAMRIHTRKVTDEAMLKYAVAAATLYDMGICTWKHFTLLY